MPRGTGILPVGLSPNFNRRWYYFTVNFGKVGPVGDWASAGQATSGGPAPKPNLRPPIVPVPRS